MITVLDMHPNETQTSMFPLMNDGYMNPSLFTVKSLSVGFEMSFFWHHLMVISRITLW